MQRVFYVFTIACLLSIVVGCGSVRKGLNFETQAVINFSARDDINPDVDGRASPVVIRLLKLEDNRQIYREEFLNLYEDSKARLGSDLIGTVVLRELAPSEQRQELIDLTPSVRYIGLLAEFVDYENAKPILVLEIDPHKKNKFDVVIKHLELLNER
ncbi:MAG: type VI secretion system protein VasD [Flavobacteriales bacterium]|jgi:type VI secretion system protein VasD